MKLNLKLVLAPLALTGVLLPACASDEDPSPEEPIAPSSPSPLGGAPSNTLPGAGGSTASGGTTMGTGGMTALPPRTHNCAATVPQASASHPMIDDLEVLTGETPDNNLPQLDGRLGYWYVYSDMTGTQTPSDASGLFPAEGGAPDTTIGADGLSRHISMAGEGFTSWGAAIALFLNNDFQNTCLYDASTFDGIQFYARGQGTFRFGLATAGTQSIDNGGSCDPTFGECGDQFSTEIVLTESWQLFEISWSDLAQGGWGQSTTFSASELIGLAWQTDDTTPFNIDIDELSFFGAGVGAGGATGQ